MRVLISACLLGCACRYDGRAKPLAEAVRLQEVCSLIPVCPEQLGGLPTPRPASERRGSRVVNCLGEEVTEQYRRGAEEALRLARLFDCRVALLKERSPSCGSGVIYDGSFSQTRIAGDGVTAELLKRQGILVLGEGEIPQLLTLLDESN